MAGTFIGLTALSTAIDVAHVVRTPSTLVPINADATPTFRIYGPGGFLAQGSLPLKDTGPVTSAALSGSDTIITSNNHKLQTGMLVSISGPYGTYVVGTVTSNTFVVLGSDVTGAVGQTWNATGIYDFNYSPTGANGFAAGTIYSVVVYSVVATNTLADLYIFQVT
jgi:hypothetical protein